MPRAKRRPLASYGDRMSDDGLVGQIVHLVSAATFPHAVHQLGSMHPDLVAALDLDSGEHIAAIVATAFLRAVPTTVDVDGGVDMVFTDLDPSVAFDVGCDATVTAACFEVKSMRGGFRRFFNQRRTEIGDSYEVTIRTITDIAGEAELEIRRAADALRAKTDSTQSRNIMIIVHSFEHLAIEVIERFFLLHLLASPGDDLDDIATIWMVFYPSHVVRWERSRQRWVNLGTGGAIDGDSGAVDSFGDVLTASERLFCETYCAGRQSAWAVF